MAAHQADVARQIDAGIAPATGAPYAITYIKTSYPHSSTAHLYVHKYHCHTPSTQAEPVFDPSVVAWCRNVCLTVNDAVP